MKQTISIFFVLLCSNFMLAQVGGWNPARVKESREALENMVAGNPKLQLFVESAYAYAVFPKVTKGAYVLGGAMGKGVVFRKSEVIGASKMKQANVGLQIGGQQYSEVIFFENKAAFENFINGNLKFDAQASAVVLDEGASIDVAYHNHVAVFTKTLGGFMLEASIGGQHFKYKALNKPQPVIHK